MDELTNALEYIRGYGRRRAGARRHCDNFRLIAVACGTRPRLPEAIIAGRDPERVDCRSVGRSQLAG